MKEIFCIVYLTIGICIVIKGIAEIYSVSVWFMLKKFLVVTGFVIVLIIVMAFLWPIILIPDNKKLRRRFFPTR